MARAESYSVRAAVDYGVVGGQAIVCEARATQRPPRGMELRLLLRSLGVDMVRVPV